MVIYDSKPSVYEGNGDGSFTYRRNIKEVKAQANTEKGDTQEQKTHRGATLLKNRLAMRHSFHTLFKHKVILPELSMKRLTGWIMCFMK
jgi:hypothetical protein